MYRFIYNRKPSSYSPKVWRCVEYGVLPFWNCGSCLKITESATSGLDVLLD